MTPERYIGEILVRQGALSPERLEQALAVATEKGVHLRDVLTSTDSLDESSYVEAIARELGLPVLTRLQTDQVPAELIEKVPINFARQHGLLPLSESDGAVRVAMSNVLDLSPLDDLRALLGRRCEVVAVPASVVEDASELSDDATVDIAAARMPAITRPDTPGGSCSTMKRGKISSGDANCWPM